jgi:alpha-galactosidase
VAHDRRHPRRLAEHDRHRFSADRREQYAGPGGWNDTDMLVVRMVGWSQGSRPTNSRPTAVDAHIAGSALLIGADLSRIDEWTTDILGTRCWPSTRTSWAPGGPEDERRLTEVWARPLADGTIAAGLFNRGPSSRGHGVVVRTWG